MFIKPDELNKYLYIKLIFCQMGQIAHLTLDKLILILKICSKYLK